MTIFLYTAIAVLAKFGGSKMAVNTINFRLMDDEEDSKLATVPLYVPTGFTLLQYQAFADLAAPLIDAVTGSEVTDIDMTIALGLPGGLKSNPVANALNERGGLIGMSNAGQFNDSVRIPAILPSIMGGDTFLLTDTDIAALVAFLIVGDTTVIPRTRDGFTFSAGLYGRKSFRRK